MQAFSFSLLIIPFASLAFAMEGTLDGNPSCANDGNPSSLNPTDCINACGALSGRYIKSGDYGRCNNCYVWVTDTSGGKVTSDQSEIRGQVASDACGQLWTKDECKNANSPSTNFKGVSGSNGAGTLHFQWIEKDTEDSSLSDGTGRHCAGG